jgi:hypothetical protein
MTLLKSDVKRFSVGHVLSLIYNNRLNENAINSIN